MAALLFLGNVVLMFVLLYNVYKENLPSRSLCWTYYVVLIAFGVVYLRDGFAASGFVALMTASIWGYSAVKQRKM